MKNTSLAILIVGLLIINVSLSWSQAPQKMSYQAVIHDANGEVVANTLVGMQISILQGFVDGRAVYVELHAPQTNINGLVTLEIGNGSVISGGFGAIDWSLGPYYIKTETDITGGTSFNITGVSQLMSVPYALYAETAGNADGGEPGPPGPEGKSAYEVWLEEGNAGTEEEFIISLQGPKGGKGDVGEVGPNGASAYQVWLDNGNVGTMVDYLESIKGEPGNDGTNGRSAYEVWKDEGNVGTEADFLASLKGADGTNGTDGKSAYQSWLDEGNTGTEADFLASVGAGANPAATTAFKGRATGVVQTIGAGVKIVLDEHYDLGANFNDATDEYVVPSDGLYHFDALVNYVDVGNNDVVAIEIQADGSPFAKVETKSDNATSILQLVISTDEMLTSGQVIILYGIGAGNDISGEVEKVQFSGRKIN